MAESDRRLELVGSSGPGQHEAGRAGLGLLLGLAIGHRPLLGAASGRVAFEIALGSFVLIVLIGVGSVLFVGYVYDRLARAASRSVVMEPRGRRLSDEDGDAPGGGQGMGGSGSESHEATRLSG